MELRQLPAGAIVFRQGEYSQDVYRIVSGKAVVSISHDEGQEITLAELGADDIFGEMAMIDESPRSATIKVTEDAELEVMEPYDFTDMFFSNPTALAPYLTCLIDRLRTSNEKVNDLTEEVARLKNGKTPTRAPLRRNPGTVFGHGLVITPKTQLAKKTIFQPKVSVTKFPYRIGRSGSSQGIDLLQKNDLSLVNVDPSQVAKSHISIESENESLWVRDRKTRRGTIVNGKKLHQDDGNLVCRLTHKVNEIILGDENSPAVYELRLV
ncbi:MAG: cyclic nucleotide-binding domain-containing protein [Verrucomicrobiota bacterium]